MVLAALIISIVALMIALFAVLREILEKPKIVIGFRIREVEKGRVLLCDIYNYPITNRLLRLLGSRRMVARDIMASFSIKECGSDRVVFPGAVPHMISYTGTTDAQRISLAPSPFPASFGIVGTGYAAGSAEVFEENMSLPAGVYCACVHANVEGEAVETQRNFVVEDKHPFAYWQG